MRWCFEIDKYQVCPSYLFLARSFLNRDGIFSGVLEKYFISVLDLLEHS